MSKITEQALREMIRSAEARGERVYVEAGDTPEDYDTGWVYEGNLGDLMVSWDSGVHACVPGQDGIVYVTVVDQR